MELLPKEKCTGCGSCGDSCPREAIEFIKDNEGFLYPKIQQEKCIECGECRRSCPVITLPVLNRISSPKTLAVTNRDKEVRIASTSGGVFSALAEKVFNEKGHVGGAVYGDNFDVFQIITADKSRLIDLRCSKYVQSDARGFYQAVKKAVSTGANVLACACPCQIAGLYAFLGNDPKNLLTCDFICLGINSPKLFKKYISFLEEKYNKKIISLKFKDKTFGWHRFSTRIQFSDGQIYCEDRYNDLYMKGYLKPNNFARPCCYDCGFKGLPRYGDITLADFWGINKIIPEMDDDCGTSLVLLNSDKGMVYFYAVAESSLIVRDSHLNAALPGNVALFNSMKRRSGRDEFYRDLNILTFDKLIGKYEPKLPFKTKLKRFVYSLFFCFKNIRFNYLWKV